MFNSGVFHKTFFITKYERSQLVRNEFNLDDYICLAVLSLLNEKNI